MKGVLSGGRCCTVACQPPDHITRGPVAHFPIPRLRSPSPIARHQVVSLSNLPLPKCGARESETVPALLHRINLKIRIDIIKRENNCLKNRNLRRHKMERTVIADVFFFLIITSSGR